ncbi:IS4 family transposase [Glycomyces rhizosphaerae]|uniref:IS4 family transposase n=1 Tax=Glycomyces rhizosphaerae TaxID=2054422 RepID=A0ABV7Q0Q8_9ACTN
MPAHTVITRVIRAAGGVFAPGHLGELTRIVPFEMVDAVLADCDKTERRRRLIPARVVVYLLLAAGLFAASGWPGVWRKLTGGLGTRAEPTASALYYARKRLGPGPLKALFDLLCEPTSAAARWRGLLVCAIDGTLLDVPASAANLAVHRSSGHTQYRGSGYPQIRLVALIATGSRALLGAVFGPIDQGETTMAARLGAAMGPGRIILADRLFDAADLLEAIRDTGADLLVRVNTQTRPRHLARLADSSRLVQRGNLRLRLIEATITIATSEGTRTGHYRLQTSLLDVHRYPATEVVALYHQRWEIETVYCELKSALLRRRVLRASDPAGLDQEIWALLVLYQAIRIAIADALIGTGHTGVQASFTIAVESARDQITRAQNITDAATIDLKGHIGQQVLAHLLPERRLRTAPRVVKRAISKHRAKGPVNRRTYKATLDINVIASP